MRLVWEDHFDGDELNASAWNVLEQVHRGHYMIQPLVELYGGFMVVLKVS
jgi:hypothetical protein